MLKINYSCGDYQFIFKNIELNHDKILKEIQDLKFVKAKNNYDIEISVSNKILDILPSNKIIKKVINKKIKQVIDSYLEYNVRHKIVTSWATKSHPNNDDEMHQHRNYWLSACYYPHGNKQDNFKINFKSNKQEHWSIPIKKYNMFNSEFYSLEIEKGDLIIFPSNLFHCPDKNVSSIIRHSLAINILPVGKIGVSDSELIIK